MKTNFRKTLSVLLAVMMLVSVFSVSVLAASYTITFKPGRNANETSLTDTITAEGGTTIVLPGAMYTRDGYVQAGWSTVQAGTKKNYELGGELTVSKKLTLYPYWEVKTAVVSFEPGAYGIGEVITADVGLGKTTKFPGAVFTREDYVQVGWSSSDGGALEYGLTATTPVINDDIAFYPVWEKCDYTVAASTTSISFGSSCIGYSAIEANELVITNKGNMTLTYTLPESETYSISVKSGSLKLDAGESVTIEIVPVNDLAIGNYEASFVFDCDYDISDLTVVVRFKVTDHSFTRYTSNNDATYTSNGTKTAYCSNGCGASDTIEDEGSMKVYSADNNTAIGLSKEYIYHRTVRFTAFGSGMDANGEINTRFVPVSWYVTEEFNGEFTGNQYEDGYDVNFTHTLFGNYTLTINYIEEEYNAETGEWVATGVTDEKTFDYVVGTNEYEEQEIVRPNTILNIIFGLFAQLLALLGLGG